MVDNMKSTLMKIRDKSHNTFNFWCNPIGWAPESASAILTVARLDWLSDLTDSLEIWVGRSFYLTQGELLLACSNVGALVEGWLKLFYCVYYEDYSKAPVINRKGTMIAPNDLKFENLKQFSRGILWESGSDWDDWIERIQYKRNAIHAFNTRDIGSSMEFLKDIDNFYEFISIIDSRLPYPDHCF